MSDDNDKPTLSAVESNATVEPSEPQNGDVPDGILITMQPTESGGSAPSISTVGDFDVLKVLTVLELALLRHKADLGIT